VLALLAGVGAVAVVATSDFETSRGIEIASALVIGWSFCGTGLYAWWREPTNASGRLMFCVGLTWLLTSLMSSNAGWALAVGLLASSLPYALLIHMLLGFPDGRLHSRLERAIVATAYLDTTFVQLLFVAFYDSAGGTRCDGCPANPLLVSADQSVFDAVNAIQNVIAIVAFIGLVVALRRRWAEAGAAERKAFAPVLITGAVALTAIAIVLAIDAVGIGHDVVAASFALALVPIAAVPFAFLAGLLRSRLTRADAVTQLVRHLGTAHDPRHRLRDGLAAALGDPSLEVAYYLPETGAYVDSEGRALDDVAMTELVLTPIEHEGRRIAAILHDPALVTDEELVKAVGGAVALTLENERLNAELRAKVEELRASRARIVEAGYEQRRRVERDLHDGAQQRLLAMGINLRLAREKLPAGADESARFLDEALDDLGAATHELRELGRGIHPAMLTERGLKSAVNGLAARIPLPVEVLGLSEERLPGRVEATAYFVIAEALTNAAKYAEAHHAEVRVRRSNGEIEVEIRDDGLGGADPDAGSGLRGLADRVAGINGRLEVRSPSGRGTSVRAWLPCA
jgi:signal transduction histidine kinase